MGESVTALMKALRFVVTVVLIFAAILAVSAAECVAFAVFVSMLVDKPKPSCTNLVFVAVIIAFVGVQVAGLEIIRSRRRRRSRMRRNSHESPEDQSARGEPLSDRRPVNVRWPSLWPF